jgi:hypothetical protein
LTCHEMFWSHSHTTSSVVLDPAHREPIVAGSCSNNRLDSNRVDDGSHTNVESV